MIPRYIFHKVCLFYILNNLLSSSLAPDFTARFSSYVSHTESRRACPDNLSCDDSTLCSTEKPTGNLNTVFSAQYVALGSTLVSKHR